MAGASRSRNVNRYVFAVLAAQELGVALREAVTARGVAERALSGGQWAEARRILGDQALRERYVVHVKVYRAALGSWPMSARGRVRAG